MDHSAPGACVVICNAGDELTPWSTTVLQEHMNTWAELLQDPTPIHIDRNAVREAGLGNRTINQGPANLAYIFNMLHSNFPSGEIRWLDTRMTSMVCCGDNVEVGGRVIAVQTGETHRMAICQLTLRVSQGVVAVMGEARVRLPLGE